jgi:hypothetical protein
MNSAPSARIEVLHGRQSELAERARSLPRVHGVGAVLPRPAANADLQEFLQNLQEVHADREASQTEDFLKDLEDLRDKSAHLDHKIHLQEDLQHADEVEAGSQRLASLRAFDLVREASEQQEESGARLIRGLEDLDRDADLLQELEELETDRAANADLNANLLQELEDLQTDRAASKYLQDMQVAREESKQLEADREASELLRATSAEDTESEWDREEGARIQLEEASAELELEEAREFWRLEEQVPTRARHLS